MRRQLTVDEHRARFWAKVERASGCWIWIGNRDAYGYGRLMRNNRWFKAHRVSWELSFGAVPPDMCVCHHCDNPACVRPGHLFVGPPSENLADMSRKGRRARFNLPRGEHHHAAKLTPDNIREIRTRHANGESQVKLARDFAVKPPAINKIVLRKRWKNHA